MLRHFVCLLLSCTLLTNASEADEKIKVIGNSTVKEVTLYLNSARVIRTGSIQLEAGRQLVVFGGLSPYVDSRTLTVTGSGMFSILNTRYELNYLAGIPEIPELKKLEDSLEALTYQLDQLLNRKSVVNEEQALLLANKTIGGSHTGLNSRELELVADIFRRRLSRLKDEMLDLNQKEKKQRERIQKLQNQLNTYRSKRDQPSGSVLLEVDARSGLLAGFEISYQVSNVSWSPFYEIHASQNDREISLLFKAAVTQTTGEDWKKTKIRLSTYNPSQGNYKPELYPWYLQIIRPFEITTYREPVMPMLKNIQEADKAAKADVKASGLDEFVSVNQFNIFNVYDISLPYDILSDGKEYHLKVQQSALPASQDYYSVPKVDPDVFVVAGITGWQDLDLIPGRAAVYYDGSFTGEAYINPAETGDTLNVAVGRDKQVIVKRELVKEFTSGQIIGNNRIRTFSYDLKIHNTRSRPVRLTLEDQLPVSQDKDIEVKAAELSGADLNPETGKLTWKLDLKAGEKITKRFSYTVKFPKDKRISGL